MDAPRKVSSSGEWPKIVNTKIVLIFLKTSFFQRILPEAWSSWSNVDEMERGHYKI